jgi:hypothetical protein
LERAPAATSAARAALGLRQHVFKLADRSLGYVGARSGSGFSGVFPNETERRIGAKNLQLLHFSE